MFVEHWLLASAIQLPTQTDTVFDRSLFFYFIFELLLGYLYFICKEYATVYHLFRLL